MAGLLDYLTNPIGTVGAGLLGNLADYYRNMPQPQVDNSGAQYDPMGSFTGINVQPQATAAPPSVFNTGAPAFMPSPSLPAAQPAAPQAAPQPQMENPISVGGYQMPRIGNPDEYLPQQAMTPPNATPTQGQMPTAMPQQGALPPALEGPSALGRLFNPNGLIAKLTGNDTRSMAQQNLRAQYEALVPIVGRQKAMLAVMNPEAGKTILDQALSSKQKFTEIGVNADGTKQYGFVNDRDQTVSPYAAPGSETSNTVTGPDGKQIAIPPGVDRKTFVNEISRANAKAQAGEKTEVQAKSEKFANKMETAEKNLSDIVNEGTSVTGRGLDMVPGGNFLQSDKYQKYRQAQDNFITALLRDESGAAIGTAEFKRYERELFPQPGDGPQVIAQKAEARKTAIEAMKKSAGPGYKAPEGAGPQVGAVQQGYRFKGGNPADRNSWERVQ